MILQKNTAQIVYACMKCSSVRFEQSKPWNTQGLSGVYGFLKKFYNLYFDGDNFSVSEEEPTKAELKVLHTLIKKFTF